MAMKQIMPCRGQFPGDSYVPFLLFFRIHSTNMSQSLPSQRNSFGENLPESLHFDRYCHLSCNKECVTLTAKCAQPQYIIADSVINAALRVVWGQVRMALLSLCRHQIDQAFLWSGRKSGLVSSQDVENLECYNVIANPKYFFNLKIALVDSSYFDYQARSWVCMWGDRVPAA